MLTLTRKPGESIFIGDDIEVTVKEIRGGAVRIGIGAPSHVAIYRGELYRKILRESQRAANASAHGDTDPAPAEDAEVHGTP